MKLDLNPKQEQAARHVEGPLLVLAGAGSGKTRVVTSRIVYLLEMGVPASEILALTFTNKAAGEMQERILKASPNPVLTCTFHSLGARILRESIHILGYANGFTIYDEKDSEQLLKHCLNALGYKEEKSLTKGLKGAISQAKNDLISPQDISHSSLHESYPLLKELYPLYQDKLKEYNALDFDDLLFLTVTLFRSSKETLQRYQKRWSFILIDEYQDTNAAQYFIAKLLTEQHHNLFVVGDPDQSIYSWRGANLTNILDFEHDYPGAQVVTLEQNYRSSSNILQAANALIEHNQKRYEKNLWSEQNAGEKIGKYIALNEKEEAEFVVSELLKRKREEALSLNDCVIFYRTNAQSRSFEDMMLKYQVPYKIIGGLSFYQRREIKDMLALLRVVISPSDYLSFVRTVNLPKRGLGQATLQKLQALAEKHTLPILTLCHHLVTSPSQIDSFKLSKKQLQGLQDYVTVIQNLKHMIESNQSIADILQTAIESSHYLDYLKEDKESYEERKANVDELISKAAEWAQENPEGTLEQFLEELSLKSSLDEQSSYDTVKLMTLHHGKGLEFTLTFMVGLEEDLFPHVNAKDSIDALEEERRLCYVGMTRAKRFLYLTASQYRLIWGMPRTMRPSRFFQEIPDQYVQSYNLESNTDDFDSSFEESSIQVGSIISHQNFGKGMVKKVYQTSFGITYDIHFFETNTMRSLVSKYAKIKVLPD